MSTPKSVAAFCKRHAHTLQNPEPEAPATWRGRLARSLILLTALTLPAHAQLDTNNNGMSDVWERQFNRDNPGQLFDTADQDHHPTADPDNDGWTNLQESIAGTNPFIANPPDGKVVTYVTYLKDQEFPATPEDPARISDVAILSWDTLSGKQYTVYSSPHLTAASWIIAEDPMIGAGVPMAVPIELIDEEATKLFWRVEVDDIDSDNDGLTDHEEYQIGLSPFVGETHPGIPDLWIATHFPSTAATFDPDNAPHANGLTNQQMYQHGIDPDDAVIIGLANPSFNDPIIDSPDLSFRKIPYGNPDNLEEHEIPDGHHPSDLYHLDSVSDWQAVHGDYIEIWDEEDGNPYVELQAHLEAHGVKQQFRMLPGTRLDYFLRYKGRYNWEAYDNAFDLKVEGAAELLVDGNPADVSGGVWSHTFMEDDESGKYEEWHYASISIISPEGGFGLSQLTLSLVPVTTTAGSEHITYGGFVDVMPVEITVAFGTVVDPPSGAVQQNSRELLENYLNSSHVKVKRVQDLWLVNGKDSDDNDKRWVIEIVTDQVGLNSGLGAEGRIVVFDGHSNYGLGPEFLNGNAASKIRDFTNYGVGYTDIPRSDRKTGQVNEQGIPLGVFEIEDNQIPATPKNYKPSPIEKERFPNENNVLVDQNFALQEQGLGAWHYMNADNSLRLMIDAPDDDLPIKLAYKSFFFNACSTGIDYIENFNHGDFIYTNDACFVHQGTKIFVQGVIDGKSTEQIMPLLNAFGVGSEVVGEIMYSYEPF